MILLDTHALFWLAEDDSRLGKTAREAVAQAAITAHVLVSAVSFWEIGMLLHKRRIALPSSLSQWADAVEARPEIRIVPVDAGIAVEAGSLPEGLHGDPGDRLLVATGRVTRVPLLTADSKILAYAEAGHVDAFDARR